MKKLLVSLTALTAVLLLASAANAGMLEESAYDVEFTFTASATLTVTPVGFVEVAGVQTLDTTAQTPIDCGDGTSLYHASFTVVADIDRAATPGLQFQFSVPTEGETFTYRDSVAFATDDCGNTMDLLAHQFVSTDGGTLYVGVKDDGTVPTGSGFTVTITAYDTSI